MRKNKRVWAVIGVGLFVIITANLFVRREISETYTSLINNQAVMDAFYGQDPAKISQTSKAYQLSYQKFSGQKLIEASAPDLPMPQIVRVQQSAATDVLQPSRAAALAALTPYRFSINHRLYVGVPLCPNNCAGDVYIIYKKVLP